MVLILGGGIAVDEAVETYARRNGVPFLTLPARWNELDRAAGPIRNNIMVDLSHELLAFWDGQSTGTGGTIKYAKRTQHTYTVFSPKDLLRHFGVRPPPVIRLRPNDGKRELKNIREALKDSGYLLPKKKRRSLYER